MGLTYEKSGTGHLLVTEEIIENRNQQYTRAEIEAVIAELDTKKARFQEYLAKCDELETI